MKRILMILLALVMLTVTASAQAPSVVDKEELLSQTEAQTLETSFNQYHEEFGFTVAAATAESFDGLTAEEYARKCYANNGYDNDGILLLISEAEGQWYLYTSGICAEVITDDEAARIGELLTQDLVDGNYYNAFKTFAEKCTEPICKRLNADAITEDAIRNEHSVFLAVGLAGGMGMGVIAAVVLWLMNRYFKKKKEQTEFPAEEM